MDMTATDSKLFTFEKSAEIFNEAKTLMPGGVSSPVRAFTSVGGAPVVFEKVKGAYAWDMDGNKYIDYVGTWGPAIVGHAHDEVRLSCLLSVQRLVLTSSHAVAPLSLPD
jgi:glutamate-1-semialdehyde 2,1-aminomutase